MSGFEASVLWDVTPCAVLNWQRAVGGILLLHVQGALKRQPIDIFPSNQFAQGLGFPFIIVLGYVYPACNEGNHFGAFFNVYEFLRSA
jgi:hypothetical protein